MLPAGVEEGGAARYPRHVEGFIRFLKPRRLRGLVASDGSLHYPWPDMDLTLSTFRPEMVEALRVFERHIVCLEKTPEDCEESMTRLVEKAIDTFQKRGPNLRHGIALDRYLTVILSETDNPRPLCGIYFNLYSPYSRKPTTTNEAAGTD